MDRMIGVACLFMLSPVASAQVPYVIGSWSLDTEASIYPGPPPRLQVRTYFPLEDGFLLGMVITIGADGNPSFLQFAAKPDGVDYPEYDPISLAALQMTGELTTATYSETAVDEYTVEWIDKVNGEIAVQGIRQVSEDGETLTIEFDLEGAAGANQTFRLIYERQ